jgi:hypothetical protein
VQQAVHPSVAVEDTALVEARRIRLVVGEGIVHLGDILVVAESYPSMEAWVEGLVHIDLVVVLDHNLAAEEAVPIGLVVGVLPVAVVHHNLPVAVVRHNLPVVVDNLLLVVRHTLAEVVGTLQEGSRLVVDSLLEADLGYIDQAEDRAEDRNLAGESLKIC